MGQACSWNNNLVQALKDFVVTLDFVQTAKHVPADGAANTVATNSSHLHVHVPELCPVDEGTGQNLVANDHADLKQFFHRCDENGRVIHSKIGYRYSRLLERCFQHLGMVPNPA